MDTSSNPVVVWLENAIDFVNKNKKPVLAGVVGVAILAAATTGYCFYRTHVREQAHKALIQALRSYDGVVGKITSADANSMFFGSEIEKWKTTEQLFKDGYENYKSTELAPMFRVYQSEALLHLGKLDEAITALTGAVDKIKNHAVKDFYQIKLALMKLDSGKELDQQQALASLKAIADNNQSIAHESALYQLGAYYWSAKKFVEAKNYWQILLVKYGTRDAKNPSPYAEVVKEKLALVSVESLEAVTQQRDIRVRFAQSPTGHLHIGGLRSALFNWLFARHNGGKFLIRIEDTDVVRSKPEYVTSILHSMEWMGLASDEPIVYQLDRIKEHRAAAHELIKKGLAYPCFCQPKDADQVIFDLEQGKGSKYQGTCRDKPYTEADLQRPHAIRFRVPDGLAKVDYQDLVLGNMSVDADQLDDFVIMRRDGTPIYNFCVVVDDIFMHITHVIRGQDHVSNTSKQVLFYEALGACAPIFAHIPLILAPNGSKLSKRDASVAVEEYCAQGFLPEALLNYLVRLGWSHGDQEIFTRQEIINYFALDAVGKKGAIFDIKKLQWLNGHYLRESSVEILRDALNKMDPKGYKQLCSLWAQQELDLLIGLYKQRATTLREILNDIVLLANNPSTIDASVLDKWKTPAMVPIVQLFSQAMAATDPFTHQSLIEQAKGICEQHNEKLVTLAQPLRLALTGGVMSPGIFELIEILGKERALERVQFLLNAIAR